MRTRSRQTTGTYVNSYKLTDPNGSVLEYGSSPMEYQSLSETITDVGGPRDPRGRFSQKYVQHSRVECNALNHPSVFGLDQQGRLHELNFTSVGYLYRPYANAPMSDLEFRKESFKSFTEHIPRTWSAANFLLELPDLPSLIKGITKLKLSGIRSFKHLRKEAGKKWLEYNFGLRPLIGDLTAALKSLDHTQSRIAFLQKTWGRPTTVRRRRIQHQAVTTSDWSSIGYFYYNGFYTARQIRRGSGNTQTVQVVGATMLQTLGGLDQLAGRVSALLAQAGFNRPLSIIYDAIPFSWLLDYLVDVGGFLDQFKTTEAFTGQINLSDGWASTKTTTEYVLQEQCIDSFTGYVSNPSPFDFCRVKLTDYLRSPGVELDQGTVYLAPSQPIGLTQFLNIAALL